MRVETIPGPLRLRGTSFLIGVLCALPSMRTALADEAPNASMPSFSLPEALDQARENHPRIRSALLELTARQRERDVPRAEWFPRLGASAQIFVGTSNNTSGLFLGTREVDLARVGGTPGSSSTTWSPEPSTLAALTLRQEVFDFGRIAAQTAVADALTAFARAQAETTGFEIQLAVEEAFHGVLAAKEVLRATQEAHKRAIAHRDFAQATSRSGMRPPIELTRAQASVAELEAKQIRAQSGLASARAVLAAAIGANNRSPQVDAKEIGAEEAQAPAFDEVVRLAIERNPAVAMAVARVDTQHRLRKSLLHELTPNLVASATLSGRAGGVAPSNGEIPYGAGWLPSIGNWHVGLVLQWNVFDASVLTRRSALLAREQAAEADLEAVRAAVRLAAERAFLELDAAKRAQPSLAELVKAASANQAQAEARFRAGLGTAVERADAEALLTNAQLELAIGRFELARARAVLGRVIGEQLIDLRLPRGKQR